MTTNGVPRRLSLVLGLAALALGLCLALGFRSQAEPGLVVEFEEKSQFSKIRITREKSVRTLWFVQESGDGLVESRVDLDRPHDMLVEYTRYMFLSYLFRPKPEKVLIVGLGGGSMIHFLKHYDPKVKIDVVEIDPAIVKVADKFFGVRSEGNVNIITKDALEYLKNTDARYDVVYMDAFLKPSAETDGNGIPLRLKTVQFYKDIQKKLTDQGLVAFNVHPHAKVEDDIKNIRDAFAQTYVFRVSNFRGFVVVGSRAQQRQGILALRGAGADLDRRFETSFSFRDLAERLAP